MSINYPLIDVLTDFDQGIFNKKYLGKKPVLYKKFVKNWPAVKKWDGQFFSTLLRDKKIGTKFGNIQTDNIKKINFEEFSTYVEKIKNESTAPKMEDLKYIHDIPIFTIFENLKNDVEPFPSEIFPKWYQHQWWKKIIFFYGGKFSLTPLHIDSLCTHNFFFQIKGKKRFIFILKGKENFCYPRDHNYYHVDPEVPDFEKYPLFKMADPTECIVEAGDMLYFPPICLHHVRGLTESISINLDWHNRKSLLGVLPRIFGKMKKSDIYYNLICALGVIFCLPAKWLQPFYQSYLGITDAVEE
jgi:hypothetical protein